jgi:2-succinyl-6-hydroxy-2,4-cyclohexadiene-1-carboxylate synthase
VPEAVVLLHGFGGTHRAWDGVVACLTDESYRPLAIELPGHGLAADERPITFGSCVERVLAQAPERFTLGGYSMGGRLALQVALRAPSRVGRLVLVSCSAGIEDERERAERQRVDEQLASRLEEAPLEEFIDRWNAQPLFAGEPQAVVRAAREDQRRNRADALAAALRGLGAGVMHPIWERLHELEMPATVLVGDRDTRYQAIGRRMAGLLGHAQFELVEGGHRLALENPAAVARALQGIEVAPEADLLARIEAGPDAETGA